MTALFLYSYSLTITTAVISLLFADISADELIVKERGVGGEETSALCSKQHVAVLSHQEEIAQSDDGKGYAESYQPRLF